MPVLPPPPLRSQDLCPAGARQEEEGHREWRSHPREGRATPKRLHRLGPEVACDPPSLPWLTRRPLRPGLSPREKEESPCTWACAVHLTLSLCPSTVHSSASSSRVAGVIRTSAGNQLDTEGLSHGGLLIYRDASRVKGH